MLKEGFVEPLYARRGWLVGATVLGAVAALIGSFLRDDVFQAKASVLVKLGREFMYRPELDGLESRDMYRLLEVMNSEAEILESRHLARTVVEELGVDVLYSDLAEDIADEGDRLAAAIEMFRSSTTVRSVESSSVLALRFEHSDARLAAEALNELIDRFLERHTELFSDQNGEFIAEYASEAEATVRAAAAALNAFQVEHGIVSPDHQAQLLLERKSALEQRIAELGDQIQVLGGALDAAGDAAAFRSALSGLDALGTTVASLLEQRLLLEQERDELASNYQEGSRRMKAFELELAAADELVRAAVNAESRRLLDQTSLLETQLENVNAGLRRVTDLGREHRRLTRRLEDAERRFSAASDRAADASLARMLDDRGFISVRVVDRASAPRKPLGLSLKARVVLASLVALMAAITAILAQHHAARPE